MAKLNSSCVQELSPEKHNAMAHDQMWHMQSLGVYVYIHPAFVSGSEHVYVYTYMYFSSFSAPGLEFSLGTETRGFSFKRPLRMDSHFLGIPGTKHQLSFHRKWKNLPEKNVHTESEKHMCQSGSLTNADADKVMLFECHKSPFKTAEVAPNIDDSWTHKKKKTYTEKNFVTEAVGQQCTKGNDETEIFTQTCMHPCLQTRQTSLETSMSLSLKNISLMSLRS